MLYILGDIGSFNKLFLSLVKDINNKININDTIILLGDNFYPMGVKDINDPKFLFFKNNLSEITKFAVLGNHDYQLNPLAQIKFDKYNWKMPNWYYFQKIEDMGFWFIDTCQLVTFGNTKRPHPCGSVTKNCIENLHKSSLENIINKQLTWLSESLEKSKLRCKIVVGHYPIVTNGVYKYNPNIKALNKLLFPIFKKYNVKLYISGHEHNSQYITLKEEEYVLHNIINGNTSYTRPCNNTIEGEFFYNKENCYVNLQLIEENLEITIRNRSEIIKKIVI